nr:zinc finger, CCHC-type [Tanacetum cinerariifolium]
MIKPKEDTQVDEKKDKATTAFLYQALTEDVILQVADCKSAKELWESLKKRHVGEEKVHQARLQSLMIGFQTLQKNKDDSVDAFTAKLNGYATKAKELGKTLEITFSRSNFSQGNWQRNRNKYDSKEEGSTHKGKSNTKWNKREWDMSKVQCHKCRKLGHFRKDCTQSSTTQEQSNLILEDEEPSLLMATHKTEHEEVLLNEGQIQPGKYTTTDANIWYLDNGASNHMTGTKSHFRDYNHANRLYQQNLKGCKYDGKYLLHTRLDISYSVGLLNRFMQEPKDHHLNAIKQVIRYIKRTKEHGIIDKKDSDCKFTGYSESSYGVNTDQGKRTTGIVFYFGESPITWCTQKQPTVALSSCESEFMAATGAASITLVRNPVFHGRSKHIDIRYHFIRECIENGHINMEHISGELQRADILTKALPRLKFVTMRQMLGVQDLGRSNDRD